MRWNCRGTKGQGIPEAVPRSVRNRASTRSFVTARARVAEVGSPAPRREHGSRIFAEGFFPGRRAIAGPDTGRQDKNLDVMVGQAIKRFGRFAKGAKGGGPRGSGVRLVARDRFSWGPRNGSGVRVRSSVTARLTGEWNGTDSAGRDEDGGRINKTLRFCRRCIDVVFILSSLMSTCELDRFVIQTPYIKVVKSCSAPFVDRATALSTDRDVHDDDDDRAADGPTERTNAGRTDERTDGWTGPLPSLFSIPASPVTQPIRRRNEKEPRGRLGPATFCLPAEKLTPRRADRVRTEDFPKTGRSMDLRDPRAAYRKERFFNYPSRPWTPSSLNVSLI